MLEIGLRIALMTAVLSGIAIKNGVAQGPEAARLPADLVAECLEQIPTAPEPGTWGIGVLTQQDEIAAADVAAALARAKGAGPQDVSISQYLEANPVQHAIDNRVVELLTTDGNGGILYVKHFHGGSGAGSSMGQTSRMLLCDKIGMRRDDGAGITPGVQLISRPRDTSIGNYWFYGKLDVVRDWLRFVHEHGKCQERVGDKTTYTMRVRQLVAGLKLPPWSSAITHCVVAAEKKGNITILNLVLLIGGQESQRWTLRLASGRVADLREAMWLPYSSKKYWERQWRVLWKTGKQLDMHGEIAKMLEQPTKVDYITDAMRSNLRVYYERDGLPDVLKGLAGIPRQDTQETGTLSRPEYDEHAVGASGEAKVELEWWPQRIVLGSAPEENLVCFVYNPNPVVVRIDDIGTSCGCLVVKKSWPKYLGPLQGFPVEIRLGRVEWNRLRDSQAEQAVRLLWSDNRRQRISDWNVIREK